MDGVWKLRHPHCMYPVKAEVSGLLMVNYPNVCTKEPQSQSGAFCQEHNALARQNNIPTNLREFVYSYCGVKQNEGIVHVWTILHCIGYMVLLVGSQISIIRCKVHYWNLCKRVIPCVLRTVALTAFILLCNTIFCLII